MLNTLIGIISKIEGDEAIAEEGSSSSSSSGGSDDMDGRAKRRRTLP